MLAAGLYAAAWVLAYGQAYILAGVVQRTMYALRQSVEDKLNRLPLSYVDRQSRGDLLSRVTNDIDNLAQSLQQTVSQILTSLLTLVGVTVMMFTISPLLAVVALVTVPLSLWVMKVVSKRARPRFISQWRYTGSVNGQTEEVFTGHAIVKSFGRQRDVEARFAADNDALYETSFDAQFTAGTIQPLMVFFGNIQFVLIAVVGGLQISSGAISVGDMQAMIQYARQFSMPLTQLASMTATFQSGIASLERVVELLDAPDQTPDDETEHAAVASARTGRVRGCALLLPAGHAVDRRARRRRRTGSDDRHRRSHRCRQDDDREPADAVLRPRFGPDHARRSRHHGDPAPGTAIRDRHGAPGHVAVRRHDPRQPRLRQPPRH